MPTGTLATAARTLHTQQTSYLRKRILGAAGNAAYVVGTLPAGANILRISTLVRVVFAGGTPTISFGTAASGALFQALTGAPATTLGRNNATLLGVAALGVDVDTVITATTGGTPTSGTLDVEVEFTVNNDG